MPVAVVVVNRTVLLLMVLVICVNLSERFLLQTSLRHVPNSSIVRRCRPKKPSTTPLSLRAIELVGAWARPQVDQNWTDD